MKTIIFLACILMTLPLLVHAQFSGTALTEYQYGKLPNETADEFNSVYSRVNLNYSLDRFKFGTGIQLYQTPYDQRNYVDLSIARASYQNEELSVQLGNYNEVLGKGVLLRNYEIPGAVIEDLSFRSKQYFYKDLLGATASYKKDDWSAKVLWGYSYNNVIPPTGNWNRRRPDQIFGAEFGYHIKKQRIEFSGLGIKNDAGNNYYGMVGLSGLLIPKLTYYIGYADYLGGNDKSKKKVEPYAIYGSLGLSLTNFGLSLEYKKYENFVLGEAVINEPPALVREHSYRLLNRSTHVLKPSNESGIQLEAFYQTGLFSLITFNYTYAKNSFAKDFNYNEWFLEYSGLIFQESDIKLFADYALDPFEDQDRRITLGMYLDGVISQNWGIIVEGEGQAIDRLGDKVNNYLLGLTLRNKSKLYVGLTTEWSNDRFISDDDKLWLGGNARYKLNSKNTLQLFAGERRGGPACSAGVCYKVLDFKGVELRWTARL